MDVAQRLAGSFNSIAHELLETLDDIMDDLDDALPTWNSFPNGPRLANLVQRIQRQLLGAKTLQEMCLAEAIQDATRVAAMAIDLQAQRPAGSTLCIRTPTFDRTGLDEGFIRIPRSELN